MSCLMALLSREADRAFGCRHPNTSWVFRAEDGTQYQKCWDCGRVLEPKVELEARAAS